MVFSENVKRIDPLRVTFAQFFSEFLLLGQPCVISSDLSDSWQCRRDWVANKRINTEFLRDNFGTHTVIRGFAEI